MEVLSTGADGLSQLVEGGPVPSLEEIESVTDINEARALLQAALLYEARLDEDLEDFLGNSSEIESKLETVEDIPIKLGPVYREAKRLASTICETCTLAEAVSSKVRELDVTRERLKHTVTKMHDIIDVKNCIIGVQKSLEMEDYETAANHIQRYLNIDKSVLEESAASQLKNYEHQLKEIARKKLDVAVRADDHDNILRFCKLYTPLGLKEEGVTAYAHYLRRKIAARADQIIKHLSRKDASGGGTYDYGDASKLTCSEALMSLFQQIAQCIEERYQVVEHTFGRGSMLNVLINLQLECDLHATKVLNYFIADHQIGRIVNEISIARKRAGNRGRQLLPQGTKESEATIIEPRELADLLDNIAIINQRIEFYDQFIKKKAMEAKAALDEENRAKEESEEALGEKGGPDRSHSPTAPASKPGLGATDLQFLRCSELFNRIQELMGDYVALEEYFMVQSVKRAISMDEHSAESLTSSMVDYVFYVLQKCTQRVLSTCNIDSVCAIINLINGTLTVEYNEVLQTMLADYSLGKGPTADHKTDYMIVLNNLEVSSEYILKLKSELELECHMFTENIQKEKLKSCLHDLADASKMFKDLLQRNLEQVATTITPSIRPLVDLFVQVNYTLEEAEYAEYEINDPFVHRFVSGLEALFAPFKAHLTERNYDSLVHIVIRSIVNRLEKAVMQKRFNQLGALQLDKDLRILVSYFSGITQKTVRGEFARLNQMASILNLEKVSEVMDYWGDNSGQMTWRLTPGEVRRVLSRRVEFKSNDIAQLKL